MLEQPERVVSVGLGTMGPGVALDYLLSGHRVTLAGRDPARLDHYRDQMSATLDFLLQQEFLSEADRQAAQERLATGPVGDKELFEDATIIVESITEDVGVKRRFWADLEPLCRPDALLLTNTSGLPITEIFQDLRLPGRALGTHYWNPPYLMPLVEVTPGRQTDPAAVERVHRLLEAGGKTPVRVRREVPGLIWNRLQFALFRECLHLVEQGVATPAEIDRVIEMGLARRNSFIGPFKTADLGGADVWHGIAAYLFARLDNRDRPPEFWTAMIERGEYGLKSGQGFYEWQAGEGQALIAARNKYLLEKLKADRQ